jgi:N-acetylglucosamine-6-sulfatase
MRQHYTRREALTILAAAGAGSFLNSAAHAQPDAPAASSEDLPPNLVFIMTDDQAWNIIEGAERYPFLKTPNLKRLQQDSVTFGNAFVTTSLCSPSRATCMTGCYAHRHGVVSNEHNDPDSDAPYLPALLQAAGYETAFIGKWHMAPHARPRPGFDYWFSFRGQGQYFNPPVNRNGEELDLEGYMTDILTEEAINWITREHDKPYCLFLWHKAMHGPFKPAPRHAGLYKDVELTEPPAWRDDYDDKPAWMRRGKTYGVHAKPWKESEGKPIPAILKESPWIPGHHEQLMDYLRTVSAVDEGVGRLLDALDTTGQLARTAILYTSDNGFIMGEHRSGDKRVMWEPSIRIPLLIRLPGAAHAGTVVEKPVLNIDFAPTFLDLAGLPASEAMQGQSLVPLLQGKDADWRNAWLYEYFEEPYAPGFVDMVGVRTASFKYIHYPNQPDDIDELYNLRQDPNEMTNLVEDPQYADRLAEMQQKLRALMEKNGYRQPGPRED